MKYIVTILFSLITVLVYGQEESLQTQSSPLEFSNLFDATNKNDIACYRIPAMVTAPNGDLLAAIDERGPSCADLRGNRDINIVLRRSSDNGATWSNIERIVDYPDGKSASDPSLIVDSFTGAIFMFFNFMDLDLEKDVYYFQVVKSMDNGQTWSAPIAITEQLASQEWHSDFKFIE